MPMDTIPTASATYSPPVDQLLKLGDCRGRTRPPYRVMGFTAELNDRMERGPEHMPPTPSERLLRAGLQRGLIV